MTSPAMAPDLILLNARIRTMDPFIRAAPAIAIRNGIVLALGTEDAIRALAGPGTRILNGRGYTVLPGLQDPHIHLLDGGTDLIFSAALWDVADIAGLQAALAAHARRITGHFVMGAGWQMGFFNETNLTRQVLDAAVPDRPCLIYDGNYHNACLNSAAIAWIGLARDTPDPVNGRFVRDGAGEATGFLHEDAIYWARARLPVISDTTLLEGLRAGQAHANRHGITGIIDPQIVDHHLRIYAALAANGGLTVRVAGAAGVFARDTVATALPRLLAQRAAHQTDFFQINAAKFFLDGGLENRTAAMIAPYSDALGGNAPLMMPPDQIESLFTALDAARFQIHVHCIGDMATRAALDGFEKARAANGRWPSLHQIAHVEVVDPADFPRFAQLGVMANMQPLWACWDPVIPDQTMEMVGDRLPCVYPFRSLIDAGAPYCLGSDFSVTTLNPFEIMETAVTRQAPRRRGQREAFVPLQRITIGEALLGYTRHAAAACWRGQATGHLGVGASADLIIIDRDILTCDPYAISETEVLLTMLAGREVYRAAGFDG